MLNSICDYAFNPDSKYFDLLEKGALKCLLLNMLIPEQGCLSVCVYFNGKSTVASPVLRAN